MMDLCFEHRGTNLDWHSMDAPGGASGDGDLASSRVLMTVTLPLAEIVTSFFDKLKSRSSGFASFESVLSVSIYAFSGHDILTRLLFFCLSHPRPRVGRPGLDPQLRGCGVREERSAQGAFWSLDLGFGCAWRLRWSSQTIPLADGDNAFGALCTLQMTFLLNQRPVDALALIVHANNVTETGRYWVEKLCT